jgi:hypothetical protein
MKTPKPNPPPPADAPRLTQEEMLAETTRQKLEEEMLAGPGVRERAGDPPDDEPEIPPAAVSDPPPAEVKPAAPPRAAAKPAVAQPAPPPPEPEPRLPAAYNLVCIGLPVRYRSLNGARSIDGQSEFAATVTRVQGRHGLSLAVQPPLHSMFHDERVPHVSEIEPTATRCWLHLHEGIDVRPELPQP